MYFSIGYIIFYTTDNSKRDRDWRVHGVRGDEHTTEITGLLPMTTYFFKIQARNTKGVGPFSPTVSFRTGQSKYQFLRLECELLKIWHVECFDFYFVCIFFLF